MFSYDSRTFISVDFKNCYVQIKFRSISTGFQTKMGFKLMFRQNLKIMVMRNNFVFVTVLFQPLNQDYMTSDLDGNALIITNYFNAFVGVFLNLIITSYLSCFI